MPPSRSQAYRRTVFYVPGFDPMPPRRYRELYRRESAKQAKISGYTVRQNRASDGDIASWDVTFEQGDEQAFTTFKCLVWSDIVKSAMRPTLWNIFARSFWYYGVFITSGALFRMNKIAIGPTIAALYPPIMTAIQVLAGVVLAHAFFEVASSVLPVVAALMSAVAFFWLWLHFMRWLDRWFFAHYLMLDYAYFGQARGGLPKDISARIDTFADQVDEALQSDCDEVLVLGHSSGALIAVAATSRLLEKGAVPDGKLGLLTLGQSIPMLSFLPAAQEVRRALLTLSEAQNISWLDVSAPGDGACYPLTDPVAISGVTTTRQRHPKIVSAAFSKTLSDAQKRALRFRFFKKHFQYLCAFDQPDQYDYFQLTSGPVPFHVSVQKFRESPSKITKIYSGFCDV